MKANITLKLDTALLREIRVLEAEEGTSISALLAARLQQIVRERKTYERPENALWPASARDLTCSGPLLVPAKNFMSDKPCKYFVDTNILMYAHDRSTGVKHERARQLIERLWISGQGVLSAQVLQEFCINLRRRIARPLPVEEVRRLIQDYLSWEVVVNTPASVLQALEIEVRYKTSFWDSASCRKLRRGCGSLFRGFGGWSKIRPGSGR